MLQANPILEAKSAKRGGTLVRKGFWAVADQGLFAGSNFLVSVLLANWLSPSDYGAFSTAFAAFLLLGVIHTALLTEPMLVFAPERFKPRLAAYLGALTKWHVVISGLASLVLVASAMICQWKSQHELAYALYCFATSGPFTLYLWLMRRACYAQMNPARAAGAGLVYLLLILAGLEAVHLSGHISIATAMALMGGSSFIVGLGLALQANTVSSEVDGQLMADVTAAHWHYGKWATATALLGYVPGNIYYFLLPKVATLEQSGALRALTNLFNPFIQANAALCLLLLPAFVRQRGTPEGRRTHKLALLVLTGGPLIYWLVLGAFNKPVIHLIYHGKYDQYASLMWIIGLQPVIAGMCGVYGSLLRAHQKMNAVFWGGVVTAIGAVTIGIEMTRWFGMWGVCWSIVITYAMHHITLWLFSREIKLSFKRQASVADLSAGPMELVPS